MSALFPLECFNWCEQEYCCTITEFDGYLNKFCSIWRWFHLRSELPKLHSRIQSPETLCWFLNPWIDLSGSVDGVCVMCILRAAAPTLLDTCCGSFHSVILLCVPEADKWRTEETHMWLLLLGSNNLVSPCLQGEINQVFGRPLLTGANNRLVWCVRERFGVECSGTGLETIVCGAGNADEAEGVKAPGCGRHEQVGRHVWDGFCGDLWDLND